MPGDKTKYAQSQVENQTPESAAAKQMVDGAVKEGNEEGEEDGGDGHVIHSGVRRLAVACGSELPYSRFYGFKCFAKKSAMAL